MTDTRSAPPLKAAPEIPDHQLLYLIGRGAYGEVWLARNAIGTMRAVKIVHRRSFAQTEHFEREFKGLLKFEPISRSHDGLVDILQIGRRDDAGHFYYVMELADDAAKPGANGAGRDVPIAPRRAEDSPPYQPRTLRSELHARNRLPPAECIAIGLKLAAALEHLHANGLVHRDIKPSNIIFVNGEPKLADIGLVTAIDEARSLVGTAGYIPPEGPGTAQADLYSLGKVLYEITLGKDRQDFPQLPPDLQSHPDYAALLELNEVILKSCESDPRKRYQSAAEMRDDLEVLQRGQSVKRRHSLKRQWRLVRLGAAWLATGAGACALIVLAIRVGQPTASPTGEKRSTNNAANRYYDLAERHFNKFGVKDLQEAAAYLEQATNADPRFAQAYAALALTYVWAEADFGRKWLTFLQAAENAARTATTMDGALPEPYIARGWVHSMRDWKWEEARKEFRTAIQLSSSGTKDSTRAECHHCYAEFLRITGHTKEALEEMTKAMSFGGDLASINVRLADHLIAARRYEDAIVQADQADEMEPAAGMARVFRIRALCALGRYPEAIEAERTARRLDGEPMEKIDVAIRTLKDAFDARGAKGYWQAQLDDAIRARKSAYWLARDYAQLGETNQAINCLKTAFKDRGAFLTFYVMTDWTLDPVRSEQRFHEILQQMHLE